MKWIALSAALAIGTVATVSADLTLPEPALPARADATTQPADATTQAANATTQPATQPVAVTAATSPSTAPSAEAITAQVDAMIARLSSDSWPDREAAETGLVDLGNLALPRLQDRLKGELDEEARNRVEVAIQKIGINRTVGTSYITMHYKDALVSDVVNDFSRQCSAKLEVDIQNNPNDDVRKHRITIDMDKAPFWEAMRILGDKSGLRPRTYNNDPTMVLDVNGGGPDFLSGPSVTYGAFTIIANSATRTESINYGHGGANAGQLVLQMIVLTEPKIHVINNGQIANWLKECTDDKGESLLTQSNRYGYGYMNGRGWLWNLQAVLKDSPDAGKKIGLLRGEMNITVQVKSATLEIPNITTAKGVTKTAGDFSITIRDVIKNGDQWSIHMQIGTGSGIRPDQLDMLFSAIQVEDSNGASLQMNGRNMQSMGAQSEMTLVFSPYSRRGTKTGDPVKLTWEVPTETRPLVVAFELKDLPLP